MAYQTPKTNWTPVDGVQDLDLNRIEGNIDDLHSNSVPYSGATQDVDLAGKVLKNMQAINLQDAANDGILWKWLEGNLAGRNGNAELRSYNIADSSLKATGISMTPNGILSLLAQSYVDTNKATAQSIATSTAAKATGFANTTDRQGESVSDSITVAESGIYAIYANGAWASANIPRAYVNTYKNNANAGTVVETVQW
jgi:hypothetical protein